jgi:hypothetical protein
MIRGIVSVPDKIKHSDIEEMADDGSIKELKKANKGLWLSYEDEKKILMY